MRHLDELGGPKANNHYAAGWAVAGDAPFTWVKQVASNFGGTRNGLVVHWPKGIKARNELRTQFHHVIDVAPTILEAAHIPQPVEVSGFKQHPIEGTSMRYSFDDAKAVDRRTTQYFEINSNRGIYHDGWFAGATRIVPWNTVVPDVPLAQDTWALYNVNDDFSEAHDVAASNPAKVKELQDLFMSEGAKYHVLPIDPRYAERFSAAIAGRPELMGGRTSMALYEGFSVPGPDAMIDTKSRSFTITARVNIPAGKPAGGVIIANGGLAGGWVLYVTNGRPAFDYNFLAQEHYVVTASTALAAGEHVVKYVFDYDGVSGKDVAKAGTSRLFIDDKSVGEGKIPRTMRSATLESMDVGVDLSTPVSETYAEGDGSRFTGRIVKVTIETR